MTVSWFGSTGDKLSIKEAVQALYPPKTRIDRRERTRFSTLLLEHGEKHVQDWAVIAYTSPKEKHRIHPRGNNHPAGTTRWAQGAVAASGSSPKKSKKRSKQIDKDSFPSVHMTKIEGRLHLCSNSLVFEPNDPSRGIVRCPFSKMDGPPREYPSDATISSTGNFDPMCVEFSVSKHWLMKPNYAIGPLESVHQATLFRLTFLHSPPTALVELCQQLYDCKDNKKELLQTLLQPMYDRPFDPTNLLDVRERPIINQLRCNLLQPLQCQPGCLVLTQERLYFQPATGVLPGETTATKAQNWLQSQVVATARRYHGLKDSALELYWKDGTSTLLALERKHEREQVLRLLNTQSNQQASLPCHTDRDFLVQASQEWQKGSITNFEYLLLLNSAAGRTFQDLSRYPVFPWVIADYESEKLDLTKESTFRDLTKPVGALNADRLDYFRKRYESMHGMEEHAFLYGTHYSAAGYVLYYLVRSMPEHMLCLQNGKFDAPDRMFYSLARCYSCVLTNHADVKELIPEFYNPRLDFDFLINARGLQLGATQNGDRVNDVTLPPWAKSARDFLKKNSKALESEICTAMLPRWIDLIFGSKSRGEAAKDASNLFHRSAYSGPADLSSMATQQERFQAELQATEFGIVPDQLFIGPHPLRHETVDESFVSTDIGRTFTGTDDTGKGEAWELLDPPASSNPEKLMESQSQEPDLLPDPSSENFLNAQRMTDDPDSKNPFYTTINDEQFGSQSRNRNVPSSRDRMSLPLSGSGDGVTGPGAFSSLPLEPTNSNLSQSNAPQSPKRGEQPPTSAFSVNDEWDIKFIEKSRFHDDAVSGCSLIPPSGPNDKSVLATTSLDGGLKIHNVSLSGSSDADIYGQTVQGITNTLSRFSYIAMKAGNAATSSQTKLTEFRTHTSRDPLACLVIANDGQGGKIAFAGGHDDVVLAYGINSGCAVASVYSHRDAVTGLDLLVRPPLFSETVLWREKSTHIMVSGSWDATVKVWSVTIANGETVSINREPLAELFDADSSIVCVSAVAADGGGIVIGTGCADGSFCIWNLHSDGVKVVIHKEPARRGSGPCSVVKWSSEGGKQTLFAGFATGKVASYTLSDGQIRRASAASVGVAVQCMVYSEGVLLVGCADGGLRLIPIENRAYFSSDMSLWPAVNNKSSPGLTSVNISFILNPGDGSSKCICCTGAEDGSIALFELKKVASR